MSESLNALGQKSSVDHASIEGDSAEGSFTPNSANVDVQHDPSTNMSIAYKANSLFDLKSASAPIRAVLEEGSAAGEQYRLLRAKLSFLQKQQPLKTLLITSAVPDEGKTFVACSLAAMLAQERGKRVLLIDADFRRTGASTSLGLTSQQQSGGLAQLLRGESTIEENLLNCAGLDLHFLPAGKTVSNPSDLLGWNVLQREIRGLAPLFDWVVIDSPPIVPLADANLLAPVCDAALLVVHANKTSTKHIKLAIERIGKAKFSGVVLNHVHHPKSSPYRYYNSKRKK
jgi:capsular exopolysaccharide synthesis family protein